MHAHRVTAPVWLILLGSCLFVFALALSAYWDPSIRWLHFFQAWMYVATIALTLRASRWGYLFGLATGAFWIYTTTFVVTFFRSGLINLARSFHAHHIVRPDQIVALPAWLGNLLVVIGCVWAYARLGEKSPADAGRLVVALALSMGFLWLDILIFQPRYLGLFPALLHPHAP